MVFILCESLLYNRSIYLDKVFILGGRVLSKRSVYLDKVFILERRVCCKRSAFSHVAATLFYLQKYPGKLVEAFNIKIPPTLRVRPRE